MTRVRVEPKQYTQWRGVVVYHSYRDHMGVHRIENGYSFSPMDDEKHFINVENLLFPDGVSTNHPNFHMLKIQKALDTGQCDLPAGVELSDMKPVVPAQIKSEDCSRLIEFDAVHWLKQASAESLERLVSDDWSDGEGADDVAIWMATIDYRFSEFFEYLRLAVLQRDFSGFEVSVQSDEAKLWLQSNRPDVYWPIMEEFGFAHFETGRVTERVTLI